MAMTYKIGAENVGERLDSFLANDPSLSRSAAARLCDEGAVTVNGMIVKRRYLLAEGDVVEVALPEPIPDAAEPENIPLSVVYEDEDIIVIDKPKAPTWLDRPCLC